MSDNGLTDGVNDRSWYRAPTPPTPQAPDHKEERQVLLVDKDGRPLVVRDPRPVGFRPR